MSTDPITGPAIGSASPAATRISDVLVEALPYIRRFWGKTVVVKYGGNALAGSVDDAALGLFARDIVLMRLVGMRPIVVHGGGPQISSLMQRLGKVPEFRNGQRVTDAETVEIAQMVLVGQVNPQLVAAINLHGGKAVGINGVDAGLIRATPRDAELGFVGDVDGIDPSILNGLVADEFIPVIATVGADAHGQPYNINADAVAAALAEAVQAHRLVFLTDVPGIMRDPSDPATLVSRASVSMIEAMIADGTIAGGMVPKVGGCVHAVRHGVDGAYILDGRVPHALLLEMFTDHGVGTMVHADGVSPAAPTPPTDTES